MSNFKVGDICDFMGLECVVTEIENNSDCPVKVGVEGDWHYWFLADGRFLERHTKPSLVLKHRPRKKRKIEIVRWVNVYKNCVGPTLWSTREDADKRSYPNRIACVQVTGEAEIEEEIK